MQLPGRIVCHEVIAWSAPHSDHARMHISATCSGSQVHSNWFCDGTTLSDGALLTVAGRGGRGGERRCGGSQQRHQPPARGGSVRHPRPPAAQSAAVCLLTLPRTPLLFLFDMLWYFVAERSAPCPARTRLQQTASGRPQAVPGLCCRERAGPARSYDRRLTLTCSDNF